MGCDSLKDAGDVKPRFMFHLEPLPVARRLGLILPENPHLKALGIFWSNLSLHDGLIKSPFCLTIHEAQAARYSYCA